MELRLPVALGGPGGGTNPEQLFAAAYGACFHGAVNLLAADMASKIRGSSVDVSVAFGRDPVDGRHSLTAHVAGSTSGLERSLAEKLVRETERICPYTKMVRSRHRQLGACRNLRSNLQRVRHARQGPAQSLRCCSGSTSDFR